ncbi:hypothetical protein CAEBREN_18346 [Caenorhabditis brenneri]|uniref:Uncharacterized protein n=1 Tax=Caenorhabditis brenneri TaxID=135651 RepID=G0N3D5_CAEBE|nr:hypothetical protein CAEBREN_18346 [Caenorhabditis brenneri]
MGLGDYNAKRRIVYSEKKREDPDRKLMDDGGAIVSKYSETLDGKRFLLSDHTYNSKRVTIFASDSSLQLLSSANVVLVDGTFACTPKGYCQLFSFHIYVTKSRTVRSVLRDKRLVRAIENNPPAPQQPLMGLQLLDSFILAAKY